MLILVDVDDVCISLVDKWIKKYNEKYNDDLKIDKIHDWSIHSYCKPECGNKLYDLLTPELYSTLEPVPDSLNCINELRSYGDIQFTTSFLPQIAGVKYFWLLEHGFIQSVDEYAEIRRKERIDADCLIDDAYHNIDAFRGHLPIVLTKPWNKKYDHCFRANNWKEIVDLVKNYL